MERRPTSILAALSISVLALTLIAPWVPGQDPDRIADQGDVDAQFTLGTIYSFSQIMYAKGEGVLKDDAEAVRWYRLAAEQGYANAQFNLGVKYNFGEGVPKDDAEAVKWYRLAAGQGHAEAQGVLKDSVLTHMWLNIAGASGNEAAREPRDNLEDDMTRAEISRATELARTCMTSDYKDCEP